MPVASPFSLLLKRIQDPCSRRACGPVRACTGYARPLAAAYTHTRPMRPPCLRAQRSRNTDLERAAVVHEALALWAVCTRDPARYIRKALPRLVRATPDAGAKMPRVDREVTCPDRLRQRLRGHDGEHGRVQEHAARPGPHELRRGALVHQKHFAGDDREARQGRPPRVVRHLCAQAPSRVA